MWKQIKRSVRAAIKRIVMEAVDEALENDAFNMERQIQRSAMIQSSEYICETIELAKRFGDRYKLMKHCLELISPTGLILEFGVYRGDSIRFIGEQVDSRPVFGVDSFEGLNEAWSFAPRGAFSDVGQLTQIPENVTLIKGWFDRTLPGFLEEHAGPIALLHIDSDLYSSCSYLLRQLSPRLIKGSVIVFDELLNYPGWQRGDFKAFNEWKDATKIQFEFVGFVPKRGICPSASQVAIRIAD